MENGMDCRVCTIRKLNDQLRTTGIGGTILITRGLKERGEMFVLAAMEAIRAFDDFSTENDPHAEHDFGRVEVEGEALFWKVDYYDKDMEFGSDDPADPDVTERVLTLMFAEEY